MGNELMWLVYVVNTVSNLGGQGFGALSFLTVFFGAAAIFVSNFGLDDSDWTAKDIEEGKPERFKKISKKVFIIGICMSALCFFVPNKDTAILMAGGYLLQEVVTSEEAKELGSLTNEAVKAQLRAWAKDSDELDIMLIQTGIKKAEEAIKETKQVSGE